jgi:hypothetical protein
MFDVNKLEKEDLIEYIKKLDDVMDKKDRYIEALEERIYEQEKLNNVDTAIKDFQNSLRASIARMDRFEQKHNYREPIVMDLNEYKETDKVGEPKFKIGDLVTCSFLSGKYLVDAYNSNNDYYCIKNIKNNHSYPVDPQCLTKISKE